MDLRKFDLKRFAKTKNEIVVLPTGEYKAELKNSSTELSGNGDEVLKLVWLIKEGEYDGSHYYSYFNLSNECSLKVLFIMIRNMGINPDKIQNTDQLYGHECLLRVKLFQHPTYGPSNLILKYLPISTSLYEEIPFDLIVSDSPVKNETFIDENKHDVPVVQEC